MAEERASIFGEDDDIDVSAFKPKPQAKTVDDAGTDREGEGCIRDGEFRSRDPKPRRQKPVAVNSAGIARAVMFN